MAIRAWNTNHGGVFLRKYMFSYCICMTLYSWCTIITHGTQEPAIIIYIKEKLFLLVSSIIISINQLVVFTMYLLNNIEVDLNEETYGY